MTIMPTNRTKETQKSTKPAAIVATGIIRRGKYTLVISRELPTRLLDDCVSPLEKNIQGTSAVSTKTGYGWPSDGIFAARPKNSVKMTMAARGWINAQAAPKAVCLYRTFTSRQVRKYNSSRYAQNSLSRNEIQPLAGFSSNTTGGSATGGRTLGRD